MEPQERLIRQVKSWFVDRDDESQIFDLIRAAGDLDPRMIHLTGTEEIGKSFLVLHWYLQCEGADCARVWIDFSKQQGNPPSYLEILREIQNTLKQPFERFQERTAEQFKIPIIKTGAGAAGRALDVDARAELQGVVLSGQFSARDINNFYLQVSQRDEALRSLDVIAGLTRAFLEDMIAYVGGKSIYFFFDDIGMGPNARPYIDAQTRRWLVEDFVIPLHDELPTAHFVLTQRDELETNLAGQLDQVARRSKLAEFKAEQREEIYLKYLEKRGIATTSSNDITVKLLLKAIDERVQGKPAELYRFITTIYPTK